MTEHTKGPWSVTDNSWEVSSVYDEAGNLIAQIRIDSDVTEETQDEFEAIKEANARLIASAPDLLKTLKRLVSVYSDMQDGDGNPCPDIAHAVAVIANAEGRA